jgi:hypothetical protein
VGKYWSSLKHGAMGRNLEFSIDIEYAWKLFLSQHRLCSYTGEELTFSRNTDKMKQTASLDRLDSDKGYIENNVHWIHKDINFLKRSISHIEFLNICNKIYNYTNV